MKALRLESRGYEGTYKLVGGRPCLDFVNTIGARDTDACHDWLDPPTNLISWALALELIDRPAARALERQVGSDAGATGRAMFRVREQRATIRRVLEPLAMGESPGPSDVQLLNDLLALCVRFRIIDPVRLEWTWEPPLRLDEVTRPVIADAADVLVHAERERLGSCPGCGWLFYDSTKNRTRRWCDMADCGSRDKSRRYYYRKLARRSAE